MLLTRDSLQIKRHIQTKVKGRKKIPHANGNQMRAWVVTLISEKIDFKPKTVIKNKEDYSIMIKG